MFWTEHSERNWLPSVAASMGEHKDVIDRLGRWQADGSEAYVRTTRKIVMDVQMAAANRIRGAGLDFLGEEQLLERFLNAAEVRHWSQPQDREQWLENLRWFTGFDPDGEWAVLPKEGKSSSPSITEVASDTEPALVLPIEDKAPHGYVVAIAGSSRRRRLHQVGRCWRVPGLHYKEFEVFGDTLPAAEDYHLICHQCWPAAGAQLALQDEQRRGAASQTAASRSSSSGASSASS